MRSQCPQCHTVFRLSEEDLSAADGQVRCGHCLNVYDATVEYPERDEPHIDDISNLDLVVGDDFISPPANDVIPPEFHKGPAHYSLAATMAWSVGIIALINVFLLEYAWFHRTELATIDVFRPWVEKFCETAGCDVADLRDLSSIEMISRNVYTHPNVDNALMVTATMTNEAEFEQPYPQVQVDFSNVRGEVVAARRFTVKEYLNIEAQHLQKMQPGTRVSFTLEILDPGVDAATYEFDFY